MTYTLSNIKRKQNVIILAQFSDFVDWQRIGANIGLMIADYESGISFDFTFYFSYKLLFASVRLRERGKDVIGDDPIASKLYYRAPHRVMLHIAEDDVIARAQYSLNYQVESVCAGRDEGDAFGGWGAYQ